MFRRRHGGAFRGRFGRERGRNEAKLGHRFPPSTQSAPGAPRRSRTIVGRGAASAQRADVTNVTEGEGL